MINTLHDSENEISRNFYRSNFNVINTMLDMDWESFFGDSDIDFCIDEFDSIDYTVFDNNFSNIYF